MSPSNALSSAGLNGPSPQSLGEFTSTAVADLDLSVLNRREHLLSEIRGMPGFHSLAPLDRRDLELLVLSEVCDPVGRQLLGGWRAVSGALGLKKAQTYLRLRRWREAGLVGPSTGEMNVYDAETGKRRFEPGAMPLIPASISLDRVERMSQLGRKSAMKRPIRHAGGHGSEHGTRHDARARTKGASAEGAQPGHGNGHDACLPAVVVLETVEDVVLDAGRQYSAAEVERATKVLGRLEELHRNLHPAGVTGNGRKLVIAALIENEGGCHACYDDAVRRGHDPIRLWIKMLTDGEHRERVYMPTCDICRKAKPDVRDASDLMLSRGASPGKWQVCEACCPHPSGEEIAHGM